MFVIDEKGNLVYRGAIDHAPFSEVTESESLVNYTDKALTDLRKGRTVRTKETSAYGCIVKYAG